LPAEIETECIMPSMHITALIAFILAIAMAMSDDKPTPVSTFESAVHLLHVDR
jgi:hypothetical protein